MKAICWRPDGDCPICLAPLVESRVVTVPCKHHFHRACLGKWKCSQPQDCYDYGEEPPDEYEYRHVPTNLEREPPDWDFRNEWGYDCCPVCRAGIRIQAGFLHAFVQYRPRLWGEYRPTIYLFGKDEGNGWARQRLPTDYFYLDPQERYLDSLSPNDFLLFQFQSS